MIIIIQKRSLIFVWLHCYSEIILIPVCLEITFRFHDVSMQFQTGSAPAEENGSAEANFKFLYEYIEKSETVQH